MICRAPLVMSDGNTGASAGQLQSQAQSKAAQQQTTPPSPPGLRKAAAQAVPAAAPTTSANIRSTMLLEGIAQKVRNVDVLESDWRLWWRSFIHGTPFTGADRGWTFTLYPRNNPTRACEVWIHGELISGRIDDNNEVKINAFQLRSGAFQFISGVNVTKQAEIVQHRAWPALVVRIITIAILLLVPVGIGVLIFLFMARSMGQRR